MLLMPEDSKTDVDQDIILKLCTQHAEVRHQAVQQHCMECRDRQSARRVSLREISSPALRTRAEEWLR